MNNETWVIYLNKWLIDWKNILPDMEWQKMMFMWINLAKDHADAIMNIVEQDRKQNEYSILPIPTWDWTINPVTKFITKF